MKFLVKLTVGVAVIAGCYLTVAKGLRVIEARCYLAEQQLKVQLSGR